MAGQISKLRVHPAIGVARLGNSPKAYFFGPEHVGAVHDGPFKDEQGRVQRQAARFRIYGYDAHDRLLGEVTARDATISWTVHVANHKAAWKQFDGPNPDAPLRNRHHTDRNKLVIDPGARTLQGPGARTSFDSGKFLDKHVPLGDAHVDDHGRLVVLGGWGHSASIPAGRPLDTYANNDDWHDDTSDGPITAEVRLNGAAQPLHASPAWVLCVPPDFAPGIAGAVTLYDTLLHVAIERGLHPPLGVPSFTRDVYPILARALGMKWVSAMAAPNHGTLAPACGPGAPVAMKQAIVARLRDPALAFDVDSPGDMPMLWSDFYGAGHSLALTATQFAVMTQWARGHFVDDWRGQPAEHSKAITPAGLDRAQLEACVGGALYPGLEASWLLRDEYEFTEPFRLSHAGRAAGDVTKQMAVPWQADFNECSQDGEYAWWPSQRPDDVFPEAGGEQVSWTRELVSSNLDMVEHWHELGFVVKKGHRYVETERK